MDELDQALFKAWNEVSAELEAKPWKLARRMERVQRKEFRRPVRAWCVALRASDRRIGFGDCVGGEGGLDARCFYKGYNHKLLLTGGRLRTLCAPVRINWPGVCVVEAARLLGRDERTVWSWVKKGVLRVERGGAVGRRGKAKHLVWSAPALDPQADDGRGPWEAWGTLWQGLAERVPTGFEQRVERVTRLRAKRGGVVGEPRLGHFCGWDWVCPGRRIVDGTAAGRHVACGRVCKKLWLALPAWTIGDALGDRAGEAWSAVGGIKGEGAMLRRGSGGGCGSGPTASASRAPGALGAGAGVGSFACSRCWGLRFDPVWSDMDEAWNRFVSVVSGGLLYGREVQRVV